MAARSKGCRRPRRHRHQRPGKDIGDDQIIRRRRPDHRAVIAITCRHANRLSTTVIGDVGERGIDGGRIVIYRDDARVRPQLRQQRENNQ